MYITSLIVRLLLPARRVRRYALLLTYQEPTTASSSRRVALRAGRNCARATLKKFRLLDPFLFLDTTWTRVLRSRDAGLW